MHTIKGLFIRFNIIKFKRTLAALEFLIYLYKVL